MPEVSRFCGWSCGWRGLVPDANRLRGRLPRSSSPASVGTDRTTRGSVVTPGVAATQSPRLSQPPPVRYVDSRTRPPPQDPAPVTPSHPRPSRPLRRVRAEYVLLPLDRRRPELEERDADGHAGVRAGQPDRRVGVRCGERSAVRRARAPGPVRSRAGKARRRGGRSATGTRSNAERSLGEAECILNVT